MNQVMAGLITRIEGLIDRVGQLASLLALAIIGLMVCNVLLRYSMSLGAVWAQELEWHLLAALILLAMSYALQRGDNVRVDLFYAKFSPQKKRVIDIISAVLTIVIALIMVKLSMAYVEQAFVIGEFRAKLMQAGVQVVRAIGDAQVVLEVRSSGVGIDRDDYLLGLPPIQFTPGASGTVPLVTPELAVVKNRYQVGVAGVSYVAYWRKTGEIVASSGPYIGRSSRDDWWFFGVGPRSTGNIPTVYVDE